MSNKIQTRFGEIEFTEDQIVRFKDGMIGFPDLNDFIVVPVKDGQTFNWLQSTTDPAVAFIVTDPTIFYRDYGVKAAKDELENLKASSNDELFILSVVTISPVNREVTLNLAAPILFNAEKQLGKQVVLDNFSHMVRVPVTNDGNDGEKEEKIAAKK